MKNPDDHSQQTVTKDKHHHVPLISAQHDDRTAIKIPPPAVFLSQDA
ncbi:hypothetical protein VR7878_00488 [Vibrio ruber DSM 16370]|uniref:Uncharacterized protein n=1 Tax=Vibrio ruber (strain DSM 16370 / JCM 11486 / BCRC 17186 / CECT 7878 / LMG 23124 / VR1) TaxID=1123498 RepID=A0A1R4LB33_VIBR1|nr:hypothetical protein VR7878_00488 [Vibrio ruber DSM 16370]